MANPKYVEAIRLYVETAGDEELKALVAQLENVEGASKETETALAAMLDELSETQRLGRAAEAYRELGKKVIDLNRDYNEARGRVEALAIEMASVEKPTKAQERAFGSARTELERLGRELSASRGKYSGLRADLEKAGVAGKNYAETLQRIADRQRSASTSIKQFATDTVNARKAAADLASRRADFTKFMGDGADSAEEAARALELYRKKIAAAAAENEKLKKGAGGTSRIFDGIRGAVAGVAAVFGFREAAQGVANLLKVAAAAEDARRSLGNLYGSQAAGNRAFEELQKIARRNGLAFSDVVDQARKLMAFGLDPLNGSLQALINQNAAVGGSMLDLEGKVLALGQAWSKQKLQGEEILQLVERGVPVWDLLQKATGKNVQELQKLSEQGKLGRDVIAALYTEIGKANAGAAEAGLSSLSGLLAQARARWVEFQQAVGNAGLTEYFKKQISQLLGDTRNLDALAKRLSDGIIGTIEALRRLGGQLLPIASAVGSFTLELMRHAEAVLFLAKVYAGLRIAQVAQQFAAAAASAQAATAATTALGGAAGGAAGRVGLLGRAMALLPNILRVSVITVGIEASISLLKSLNGIMEERQKQQFLEERAAIIQRDIQRELIASGQQLTAVYREHANVAVQGGAEVSRMTKAQAQDYQFALEQARNYYRGVAIEAKAAGDAQAQAAAVERFDALVVAIDGARKRLSELSAEAEKQQKLRAYVDGAVASFDKLAAKGESVRKAISGVFDGLDLTSTRGVEQAGQILDQISARGTAASKAVREELSSALKEVVDDDLPKLKAQADEALAKGTEGAKAFAEAINSINLKRLGVDLELARTGLSTGARDAIDLFRAAGKEVKALGLTSQQQSRAMAQAFKGAFREISNAEELREIEKALRESVSAGVISGAEYNSALADITKKAEELRTASAAVGPTLEDSSRQGRAALEDLGDSARNAADDLAKVGEKGREAGEETKKGLDDATAANNALIYSLDGVSQKFIELAKSRSVNFRQLGIEFRAQQEALKAEIAVLEEQNGKYDEMAQRRKELRDKFPLVSEDAVDKLLSTEKTLSDNRKRAADEATRQADEARKAAEEALAATRAAEAERARAGLQAVEVIRIEVAAAREVSRFASDPVASSQIAAEVLRQIDRARTGSNRRNRNR